MTAEEVVSVVDSLATQIYHANPRGGYALVGLRSRGDEVAERILKRLRDRGIDSPIGVLDISLYRDDFAHINQNPKLEGREIPFEVEGAHLIIVDDVLFTGRTVRAAIDAVMDYGRPAKIELACLIDRGHRELPFFPTYIGRKIETDRMDHVEVKLKRTDGEDSVEVISPST